MEQCADGNRFVLALGPFGTQALDAVKQAAEMADERVHQAPVLAAAKQWLGTNTTPPQAVVLDITAPAAAASALRLRADHWNLALPIIGIADKVCDLTFEDAYSAGIDDVCPLDALALGRRFRHLAKVDPTKIPPTDREVVVADEDRSSRMLIGRVFRDAGYRVVFAPDAEHASAYAQGPAVVAVILSAAIETEAEAPLSHRAFRQGSKAAWIINTPPKQIPVALARYGEGNSPRIAVHDAYASPASLLFVVNDLLNKPATECRASERVLYGSSARFRHAGRDDDEVGYLFNISGEGLYVCTLAPPQRDEEMWIEFTPPRSDRRVHLEATAVWARRHGSGRSATVPCGFGARLTGGSTADLARYHRGYQTFLAERTALRESTCPPQRLLVDSMRPTVPCEPRPSPAVLEAAAQR